MKKLVAIICVVSWLGFWTFGYLALMAGPAEADMVPLAAALAGAGFLSGIISYLKLVRLTGPGHWLHVRQHEH